MVYVLDTSAILSGKFFGDDIATSPKVLEEIRPKGHSRRLLEYMLCIGMKVVEPPADAIEVIKRTATKTGDIAHLTEVDIEVIALAYYLHSILLTDDYSIQNVADELKISYESILEEGITEKILWVYRCKSCGKFFDKYYKKCVICDGKIKRTTKKN
jgi:UPF0271 protein